MSVIVQVAIFVCLTGCVALIAYEVRCYKGIHIKQPRTGLWRDYEEYDASWMDYKKWEETRR